MNTISETFPGFPSQNLHSFAAHLYLKDTRTKFAFERPDEIRAETVSDCKSKIGDVRRA